MWPLALPLRRHRATIQIPSQALPEVTIPAFLFLLFCKIIPLCSLRPLLSPTRLPDLVSLAGVLREEPVCLGAMAALCGWRRHTGCSAGPGGTLGMSPGCWGGGRAGVVGPASGTVSGAGLLLGSSSLVAVSLHPESSSARRSCSLCPAGVLLY